MTEPTSQGAPAPKASTTPAAAPAPEAPFVLWETIAFVALGSLIALGAGLGQGILSANLTQLAGDLGATTAENSWLIIAYIVPRAALPILLIKIRSQYGLRHFVILAMSLYAIAGVLALWMDDLRSAILIEILAGAASASITTLAFLYILDRLPQAWRLRLGLPCAMTMLLTANSFARMISPFLIDDGGLWRIHLFVLGLTLVTIAAVVMLKLKPVPHAKVLEPIDFGSFTLIAIGFGSVITAAVMGPIHWWNDALWIGILLAVGIASSTLAVVIELHRKSPLIDIRWLVSPAMLHLTGALLLFRLILSEQSTGAPRMFQVLGLAPSQLVPLFTVVSIASVLGGLACVAWMRPGREPQFHFVALILIATGAYMDSLSTLDTRPEQMFISQAMIGFAGLLFIAPAMMAGLLSALKKGPSYILSFIIVFISTQSVGGMLGSGMFLSLINRQQAIHNTMLTAELTSGKTALSDELALRMNALVGQIPDVAMRKAQAMAQISTEVSNQAYVMAYNDAYFLTFLVATFAAFLLVLHVSRDKLASILLARSKSPLTDMKPE